MSHWSTPTMPSWNTTGWLSRSWSSTTTSLISWNSLTAAPRKQRSWRTTSPHHWPWLLSRKSSINLQSTASWAKSSAQTTSKVQHSISAPPTTTGSVRSSYSTTQIMTISSLKRILSSSIPSVSSMRRNSKQSRRTSWICVSDVIWSSTMSHSTTSTKRLSSGITSLRTTPSIKCCSS